MVVLFYCFVLGILLFDYCLLFELFPDLIVMLVIGCVWLIVLFCMHGFLLFCYIIIICLFVIWFIVDLMCCWVGHLWWWMLLVGWALLVRLRFWFGMSYLIITLTWCLIVDLSWLDSVVVVIIRFTCWLLVLWLGQLLVYLLFRFGWIWLAIADLACLVFLWFCVLLLCCLL